MSAQNAGVPVYQTPIFTGYPTTDAAETRKNGVYASFLIFPTGVSSEASRVLGQTWGK